MASLQISILGLGISIAGLYKHFYSMFIAFYFICCACFFELMLACLKWNMLLNVYMHGFLMFEGGKQCAKDCHKAKTS